MTLSVELMNDNDFRRAFDIMSDAFGTKHTFLNQFWPSHHTEEGRVTGAQRLKAMDADPYTIFLKAVDLEQGMIGMAKWCFYKDNTLPPAIDFFEGPWWDDGRGDKKYAQLLADAFFARRMKAIAASGGNLAGMYCKLLCCKTNNKVLDYLAVDPKYHGKGAGTALTKYGLDKADEYNIAVSILMLKLNRTNRKQSTIEASAKGAWVYKKLGFTSLENCSLVMPESYAHLPREEVAWMERPRTDGYMWDGRRSMTSNWLAEP